MNARTLKMRPDFLLGMIFGLVIGTFAGIITIEFSPLDSEKVSVRGTPVADAASGGWRLTAVGTTVGVIADR